LPAAAIGRKRGAECASRLAARPAIGYGCLMLISASSRTALIPLLLLAASLAWRGERALAQGAGENITKLGGAQGWQAYLDNAKGQKICYVIGEPSKSEPANAKRAKIFASVTHRPHDKISNEVSFNVGYLFKEGSDAELTVDNKKFELFTNKDTAWARDPATDKAVVEALAKGKQAVMKGVSARGTATMDTYALAGFGQALGEIDKACGVKR
jgi:invasion associated locus B (IalB) protein